MKKGIQGDKPAQQHNCALSFITICDADGSGRMEVKMYNEIIAKCGYRCDLCLAYTPNVEAKDRRQLLSDGWFEIYGFRLVPEDIKCDGCISSESPELIDKNCPVRPCVVNKKIDNCSSCATYICEKLRQRIVVKSEIEEKMDRKLTDQEYKLFIEPYESRARLDKLRNKK